MEEQTAAEFNRGIAQFNAGDFFESHDTIEGIWIDCKGAERFFLQGLIQIAVAYYHAGNGNYRGANSQLVKAIAKLEQYPRIFMRVDLGVLLETIRLHQAVFCGIIERTSDPLAARELIAPQIIVH